MRLDKYGRKLEIGRTAKSGIMELEPNHLIDKAIIGPTEYKESKEILKRAMTEQLKAAGVENAQDKVHATHIPLRPNQR